MNTPSAPLLSIELIEQCEARILVTDAEGRLVASSLGADKALRAQPGELLGRPIGRLANEATSWSLPDGRVVHVLPQSSPDAEDTMAAHLERLQIVANAIPALICYVDADGRYVWANERYRDWFNRSPDDIRGLHVRDVLGEEGWSLVGDQVERALLGEEVTFCQHFRYPSGIRDVRATYVPHMSADGDVLGFVGLVHDISEIKSVERARRRSERRIAHSQAVAHVGSWEMIVQCPEIRNAPIWWSDELYRIFGYEPGSISVTERTVFDAIHPDDQIRVRAASMSARASNGRLDTTCRIVRPDGTIRTVHAYAEFERDESTNRIRMLGTCQDITERHGAEEALRDADRRKDEFLAMLAHELRNPLAPILTAAELLEGPPRSEQPKASLSRVIIRQVHHMKRLLDDLLDVSRVSSGKIQLRKEPVELGALLRQTLETCQRALDEKRHTLTLDLTSTALFLDADPTRLVQIFSNLLINAAKYTDPGGHISITSTLENDLAVVTVRDDGIGMRRELLVRAFDLFVQDTRSLDRAQGGLGIGLTLVRTLVDLHGGSVIAASDGPMRGSQFVVRLPLSRDLGWKLLAKSESLRPTHVPPPSAVSGVSLAPGRTPMRVLVIDDNVDAANSLGSLLGDFGHHVTIAYDGRSALAAARELEPELVFLDIGLPGMDGYSVATKLREMNGRSATLVALSGYGHDDFQRRSREAGFDGYLVKPVERALLLPILIGAPCDESGPSSATVPCCSAETR